MKALRLLRRRDRGRTLIELMVAIAIGLLITGGVLSIYSLNTRTYQVNTQLQRVQASGLIALEKLAFQVRMAGYGPLTNGSQAVPTAFSTANALQACIGVVNATGACTGVETDSDALAIGYVADTYGASAGSGADRNCAGVAAAPGASGFPEVSNRYFVALDNGVPTLMCSGNGAAPVALVPNVEQFKVSLTTGTAFVGGTRSGVRPSALTTPAAWNSVVAVELCLLVASDLNQSANAPPNAGAPLERDCTTGAAINIADGRARRVYRQLIAMRNRVV